MTAKVSVRALLVDDDPETLSGMLESLPKEFKGYEGIELDYDACSTFSEAEEKVRRYAYDLVITDFYKDSSKAKDGFLPEDKSDVPKLLKSVQKGKFCPVIIFSSRAKPSNIDFGPFVMWADKGVGDKQVIARIEEMLGTGVPQSARRLRDEVDGLGGKYLWDFLEKNWAALKGSGLANGKSVDRIVRRRASVQLSKVDGDVERGSVEGAEFYLVPKIADKEYRLGEIVKHKKTSQIRVLMTPHCHLTIQKGKDKPKAEFVLTLAVLPAAEVIRASMPPGEWKALAAKSDEEKKKRLIGWIQSPPRYGVPEGRYWFLPGFLSLADSFCDFMQASSIPLKELETDFEPLMVLDAPFAEGMQACFGKFYSAIGLANLDPASYVRIIPK